MYYYDTTSSCIGCILILLFCVILGALGGLVFMLLWNNLAPLFWVAAPILTFWQAWGCMILLSIIGNFFRSKSK